MKKPILVVLAAGIGSRYGGLKQMEKLGASGEVLLDYSVFDALRAGFGRVVFVIRRDIEDDFRNLVLSRLGWHVQYDLAFQSLDAFIPPHVYDLAVTVGRKKPWGTAHAVVCAADKIDAPFAVINADDFYGRQAFEALGKFLAENSNDGGIVPYKLSKTLSEFGTVSRGVCKIENGYLADIQEMKAIEQQYGEIFNTNPDGSRTMLAADTPVSMNFFGYPEMILPHFKKYFADFIGAWNGDLKSECYMPLATDEFIKTGVFKMKSVPANATWFGVTNPEDRIVAADRLRALTNTGEYPSNLWK